jgi:regulator of protease activity HflC (stomatin/prohibitin superfamily)
VASSNGEKLNKEARKELDKQRLAAGAKITNVSYKRIDYNKALVEFCVEESEGTDESQAIRSVSLANIPPNVTSKQPWGLH